MIRAVLFDFYGVWTPDIFGKLATLAAEKDPSLLPELKEVEKKYFLGLSGIEATINSCRRVLKQLAPPVELFNLDTQAITTQLVEATHFLHSHFLKVSMMADVGWREYELLKDLNKKHQLFEAITVSLDMGESILNKGAFVQALQAIGEPPASCLVITNNETYQQVAESYGLRVLGFDDVPTFAQEVAQLIEANK